MFKHLNLNKINYDQIDYWPTKDETEFVHRRNFWEFIIS